MSGKMTGTGTADASLWLAAAWMGGALVSFTAMAVGGRQLSDGIPIFETLFIRSLIGILVISLIIRLRSPALFKTRQPMRHLLRNCFHFAGQYAWFFGIAYLPLAEVFAIEFTSPIWSALLAALFLSERLTRHRMLASLLGFAGILVILRPGFETISLASWVVLAAAIGFAISNVFTRMLVRQDAVATVIFYMTVTQAVLALGPALSVWQPIGLPHWPWLIVVGITAVSAHYCLSQALKVADAAVVLPFDFLRLPLIAVVGYMAYQEKLDPYLAIGAGLIVIGNLNNIRAEKKQSRI